MSNKNIPYRDKRLKYINKRFGYLTILDYYPGHREGIKTFNSKIKYLCDCGVINTVYLSNRIIKNKNVSCGCYRIKIFTKHGYAGTTEYCSWTSMRHRCFNKEHDFYYRYGGRGIKICERWNDFENFLIDMGMKPSSKHSIDRINNDGDYEPSNCRWSTNKEQQLNKNIIGLESYCMTCKAIFKCFKSSNRKFCSRKCYHISRK